MASPCQMMKRQSDHPCFGGDHSKAGRIHLPVAPGCNIKCGFCERKFDCANESRPGVTSRVLTPSEALDRVNLVLRHPAVGAKLKVVGIAGPGDPLANPRTFETFRLVRAAHPGMTLCLSTNGLLLPEKLPELLALGLHSLTVTVNALTPETGAKVYEWVAFEGKKLEGEAGSALLLERQLAGIGAAAAAGLLVKVNHVYIPGVNDHETLELAVRVRADRPTGALLGSLFGGTGGCIGTVFGAMVIRAISFIFRVIDEASVFGFLASPLLQSLVEGAILLLAVSLGAARVFRVRNRLSLFA